MHVPPEPAPQATLRCPACEGRLFPRELECVDCGLHLQASYPRNEFARLDDDALHLLRIFVACEGRIRDMERALGVSYPTVKSRLAGLRETLGFTGKKSPPKTRRGQAPNLQNQPPQTPLGDWSAEKSTSKKPCGGLGRGRSWRGSPAGKPTVFPLVRNEGEP